MTAVTVERSCDVKRRYVSRKKATDALKAMHRVANHADMAARRDDPVALRGLNVYWCPHHECFHIGHKR